VAPFRVNIEFNSFFVPVIGGEPVVDPQFGRDLPGGRTPERRRRRGQPERVEDDHAAAEELHQLYVCLAPVIRPAFFPVEDEAGG
jgi:hypothetical protein